MSWNSEFLYYIMLQYKETNRNIGMRQHKQTRTKQRKTILQKIGLLFYSKRSVTSLLFIMTTTFGLLSYAVLMKREGFPSVEIPIGVVQVITFDKNAETVDATIVQPLTESARMDANLKSIQSTASDQGAMLVLTYKDKTNVDDALRKIKEKVDGKVPAATRVEYIKANAGKFTNEGDDLLVSVHGENKTPADLDAAARRLSDLLNAQTSFVGAVHLFPSVEQVTDPTTGQVVSKEVRFDTFYDAESGKLLPSTIIGITGSGNLDQLALFDKVETFLQTDSVKNLGVSASISANFAEGIREQISALQRNLLEGLAIVLLVSFVLISLRSSVVTALSMTSTILITVGVLQLIGYSLNTVTLFSLILCLALIVDDTTIMVEAIDAGLLRGKSFKDVVAQSIKKVARASGTGTVSTILAFAPMLFIGGILGKFVRAIPVTIITSLIVSYIVSFIFIPLMMRISYGKNAVHKERKFKTISHLESKLSAKLGSILLALNRNNTRKVISRTAAVFVGMAFLAGGIFVFTKVKFNIFPSPKDGIDILVSASVKDKETASIDTTKQLAFTTLSTAKDVLGKDLERVTLASSEGLGSREGFTAWLTISAIDSRQETSVSLSEKLQTALEEKVPQLTVKVETSGAGPPAGNFAVQIDADTTDAAYALAKDVQTYLQTLKIERPDKSTSSLTNVQITPRIFVTRQNEKRVVTVSADFVDEDISALISIAQKDVEKVFTEDKVASYGLARDALGFNFGQEEENQDSFNAMGIAALPLFAAMFIIMALLFRSILQPILIFTALPFAIFGIANGLYLTDNQLSFFTMLGVFALIGISLNNTILLTDYANQARKSGLSASDAMASALKERLRPLLTTSITSVLALLPLALNDPFWEGLAYTLIFGLISSTILVILVFPYYYLIEESLRELLRKGFRKLVKR